MTSLLGVVLLSVGTGLVVIAMPRSGVPKRFLRSAFAELMYPVLCLAILVVGAATLIVGLTP
jgi:hypothetical protein